MTPLSSNAAAVFDLLKLLPAGRALVSRAILDQLAEKRIFIAESTLHRHIIPALRPLGVRNKRRIGYYLDKMPENTDAPDMR